MSKFRTKHVSGMFTWATAFYPNSSGMALLTRLLVGIHVPQIAQVNFVKTYARLLQSAVFSGRKWGVGFLGVTGNI